MVTIRARTGTSRRLTTGGKATQLARMSGDANIPPATYFLWLARNTGFPAARLDARAEQLLLMGGLIQDENLPPRSAIGSVKVGPGAVDIENAQRAAQRTLAELRRRVHYKCDNSAKV